MAFLSSTTQSVTSLSYSQDFWKICWRCCDRKARAACAQSFTLWQQATIDITYHDHSLIACSRHIYMGVVLHAHPVRAESHIQRNASREVATESENSGCTGTA